MPTGLELSGTHQQHDGARYKILTFCIEFLRVWNFKRRLRLFLSFHSRRSSPVLSTLPFFYHRKHTETYLRCGRGKEVKSCFSVGRLFCSLICIASKTFAHRINDMKTQNVWIKTLHTSCDMNLWNERVGKKEQKKFWQDTRKVLGTADRLGEFQAFVQMLGKDRAADAFVYSAKARKIGLNMKNIKVTYTLW